MLSLFLIAAGFNRWDSPYETGMETCTEASARLPCRTADYADLVVMPTRR
jgi:hypothetical protein